MHVSDAGIRWSPGFLARRKHQTLEISWPEVFRAQIVEVQFGTRPPVYFMIGLRTSQGPFWMSIEQLDEPAVRAELAKHVESLD